MNWLPEEPRHRSGSASQLLRRVLADPQQRPEQPDGNRKHGPPENPGPVSLPKANATRTKPPSLSRLIAPRTWFAPSGLWGIGSWGEFWDYGVTADISVPAQEDVEAPLTLRQVAWDLWKRRRRRAD
jgi:hypothetical protein